MTITIYIPQNNVNHMIQKIDEFNKSLKKRKSINSTNRTLYNNLRRYDADTEADYVEITSNYALNRMTLDNLNFSSLFTPIVEEVD